MPATNPASDGPADPDDIDELMRRYWAGEKGLYGQLFSMLIDRARRIAGRRLGEQMKNNPMVQKTMIAIDAIQKLLKEDRPVQNLEQAMKLIKRFTGWIIEDYRRQAEARPAGELPPTDQHPAVPQVPAIDSIDLLDCVRKLELKSRRAAEVFQLRLLSGCTIDEASEALGVSHATIERQFRFALDFMRLLLEDRSSSGQPTSTDAR